MRIGIDISQIVYDTGVSRYTKEVVKNLLKIDKQNKYLLFAGVWRQKEKIENFIKDLKGKGYRFKSKIIFFPPKIANLVWNKLHILPIEKFTGELDLFHSSNWAQPPTKYPLVTTVHDLTPIKFPESFDKSLISSFKHNLYWIKKQTKLIMVDSKATKEDLIKNGFDEEKIKIIYLAASNKFKKVSSKEKIEQVKKRYKITGDYILSVGTLEPRKNTERTIKAFLSLDACNLQLVLVGKYGWGETVEQKAKDRKQKIIITGFVPDEDLPTLYSGATFFIYPSLYEGFGLPVLEAMSCGCPVITSNTSSLPELAKGAALLVNPKSTGEIKEAIQELLTSKNLRNSLIRKGIFRVKKFSWGNTARQILKIYQEAVRC